MAAAVNMTNANTSATTEFKRALESLASMGNEVGYKLIDGAAVRAYVQRSTTVAQHASRAHTA